MKGATMNKARAEYIYQLTGTIQNQKLQIINNRISYKLAVNIKSRPEIKKIRVWKEKLTNSQIWQEIQENKFFEKKYLFFCHNWMGHYSLVDWKELSNEK